MIGSSTEDLQGHVMKDQLASDAASPCITKPQAAGCDLAVLIAAANIHESRAVSSSCDTGSTSHRFGTI